MADLPISGLTALTTIADNDLIPVVDVSDTTQSSNGTTKKITRTALLSSLAINSPTLTTPVIGAATGTSLALSGSIANGDILTLQNTDATNYSRIKYIGDALTYTSGVGNSSATIAELRNKFYIYDFTNLTTKMMISTAGVTFPGTNSYDSGWIPSDAATYVSQDGSTGVFNIASDVTGKYSPGMRYKYQQAQSLTAYWTFDADSTSQVGSFNGTDTAITYTAGKFSNAATFNGTTSKIVIADNASLKPTGEFTIGCWFKKTGAGTLKCIFQSYSQNTAVAGIRLNVQTTNFLELTIGKNTGTVAGTDFIQFNGVTNVADNAYHYCVVSVRNNYCQIYLDGKLEASGYCLTPAYAATNYVRVGCWNLSGADANFFDGQIDDLFLINGYALDEKTIKKQYDLQTAQGTGSITVDKYALITAVAPYAAGVTPITIWGGTDYSLQNATISNPYYSTVSQPFGFDRNPAKWTVEIASWDGAVINTPTQNVWYNQSANSISIPIGAWDVSYKAAIQIADNSTATGILQATLSSANNSESNTTLTTGSYSGGASGAIVLVITAYTKSFLSLSSKTSHYLNIRTTTASVDSIAINGNAVSPTIIRAVSVYV